MARIKSVVTESPEATRAIGKSIGKLVVPGDVILLSGTLGAGKTTFTQGILWGLGGTEYARSPTFILVNEYQARIPVYHMDLYRLESIEEIDTLGLDDYLYGEGVCVVEWADKAETYFPAEHLKIRMDVIGNAMRRISISSESTDGQRFLKALTGCVIE